MNRKLLFQVTAPSVLIGVLLFTACLVGAWFTDRSQRELAKLLSQEVASLQAGQELEIRVRQLRFRTFLDLIEPGRARPEAIAEVQDNFLTALQRARQASHTPEERDACDKIFAGYHRYLSELESLPRELAAAGKTPDWHTLADAHPIRHVVEPCQELLRINREQMAATVQENDRVGGSVRLAMLGLGLAGLVSGSMAGFGITRGLSRSIYQLSVRVHDMTRKLDRTVASVSLPADGDILHLDRQLQYVVQRVEEVAEECQRHDREMLRAEQLSAVGQLAASVAHEVRNPLTGVKLLVEAALRPHKRQPLTEEDLAVIHGEVVRLEQTVQSFLDFARPPAPNRSVCDLREVVGQAVELVRARARQQKVAVEVHSPDRDVPADVDRSQLCTVLVNLFINAIDAMPRGGTLDVSLSAAESAILLSVADTGTGIAPGMAGRLFTPFASTKPTGTGLGLSITQRVVEEHGGRVTGSNRPEGGACFAITLPLASARPQATEKSIKPQAAERR
jgi:signal transduction histidine kinase